MTDGGPYAQANSSTSISEIRSAIESLIFSTLTTVFVSFIVNLDIDKVSGWFIVSATASTFLLGIVSLVLAWMGMEGKTDAFAVLVIIDSNSSDTLHIIKLHPL